MADANWTITIDPNNPNQLDITAGTGFIEIEYGDSIVPKGLNKPDCADTFIEWE